METKAVATSAREGRHPGREAPGFRWLAVGTTVAALGAVALGLARNPLGSWPPEVLLWGLAVLVVDLRPVPTEEAAYLDLDGPLLMGAAFIFGPAVGGLLAFAAADPREWKGEVSPSKAAFNRSQKALSILASGLVFLGVSGADVDSARLVLAGVLAVLANWLLNVGFVTLAARLLWRTRPGDVLRDLTAGQPGSFVAGYLGYGMCACLLVYSYPTMGLWTLLLALPPLGLAWLAFSRSFRLQSAGRDLDITSASLQHASEQMALERADERLTIAAALHDEVLQSLH